MRGTVFVIVGFAAIVAASCGKAAPTESTKPQTAVLKAGEERPLLGSFLFATLLRVDNESRCPSDVTCVWAGNAAAVLGVRAGEGPTAPYTVNSGIEPRSVVISGYRVTLDSLTPYPRTGQPIGQGDYVAYVSLVFMPDAR